MADLHDALARLAAEATWPPTPDLAAGVRAAIDAEPTPRPRRRARSRRPLLAALLALLVGGGVLAAPGVGSGLLERLGLRSATVTQVERLPATPLGQRLQLGERSTFAAAQRSAGGRLLRPAVLGMPRAVYVDGAAVTFAYRARSGQPILFTQVPGRIGPFVRKMVIAGTQRVRIDGAPGLLLRGRHVVIFSEAPSGTTRVDEPRLAKSTLLWERGGRLLRLEADQPAGELLRIARSVR